MWPTLLAACGLMLVLEGLLPLFGPRQWRDTVQRLAALKDGQLRFFGLAAIAAGVLILLATGLF